MCETTSEAMRRQAALGSVGDFDSERICSISSSGMFIGGASFLGEALLGPLPNVRCGALRFLRIGGRGTRGGHGGCLALLHVGGELGARDLGLAQRARQH